jgi:two-component system OmpR family sensor kinase
MFSSLRSRLWLSYVLVTAAALSVVAIVLLIYIIQNPSTYRQANARLTIVSAVLRKDETEWINLSPNDLQTQIEQFDNIFSTRIAIYGANRQLFIDSESAQFPALALPAFPRLRPNSILLDDHGNAWLYILRHLIDGRWLLIAVPRPSVPLLVIMTDELMLPVLGAGGAGLVISLLVAFWLSRWIGDPLQRVVVVSKEMPSSQAKVISLRGPREVQELTRAFNEMNIRVQTNQESQRDFVANVSHELKTPLTSIQGFSQALLDGTAATPQEQKQAARVIFDESGRMHRMVLDLLDLARLDAGTFELQHTPVDLSALLHDVAEKMEPQARTHNLEIQVEASNLPVLTGDGDRLSQVFTNLLENAIKYTPPGGLIKIKAVQSGPGVQVEVADTGKGISPEVLPNIFGRFFQADPSRSGGLEHGAGLGLAIVREILEAHGGKISVRSELNKGSTFIVYLPLKIPGPPSGVAKKTGKIR